MSRRDARPIWDMLARWPPWVARLRLSPPRYPAGKTWSTDIMRLAPFGCAIEIVLKDFMDRFAASGGRNHQC